MAIEQMGLNDYLSVLSRRKRSLLGSALVIFALAVAIALLLPSIYRSSATILLEDQEIPQDLVRSTVSSYAVKQVQVITQRVMTTKNALDIIEKYDLYSDKRGKVSSTELYEEFQENVNLDLVSADVVDPKSGRPTQATIAFTLSFDDEDPSAAQRVASELVTLYLNENLRNRTQKSSEASGFIGDEVASLNQQMLEMEKQLALFKSENEGSLPELYQFNIQLIERGEREVLEADRRIRSLAERIVYLQSELSQVNPSAPMYMSTGRPILSASDQLKSLETQYISLSAVYGPSHPDIQKINREIEALRLKEGVSGDLLDSGAQLQVAQTELAAAKEKYGDQHPDVIKWKKSVSLLEQKKNKPEGDKAGAERADNPAYLQLKTQIEVAEIELASAQREKQALTDKLAIYEQRIMKMPQVERQYSALTRDHANKTKKYQELKAKQMEAELSNTLELERKGERFTLVEPPLLPTQPEKPNRLAIIFLGFVLASAGGIGMAAARESMDDRIHSTRELMAVLGYAPIAVIPYIYTADEETRNSRYLIKPIVVSVVLLLLVLVATHFLYKPLDVIWFMLQQKL